jgi:hypothetical protein
VSGGGGFSQRAPKHRSFAFMGGPREYFVVGDIHGMLDPLNMILDFIRCAAGRRKDEVRVVFIGDYIDYGPSSSGVLDTLAAFSKEFDAVFLAGNHEDLLLQQHFETEFWKARPHMWFSGADAQATWRSMTGAPEQKCLCFRSGRDPSARRHDTEKIRFKLPKRHAPFLEGLRYSFSGMLEAGGKSRRLVFSHSNLYSRANSGERSFRDYDLIVEEQLDIPDFNSFHRIHDAKDVWIEDTFLWRRDVLREPFGDFVNIYGHSPAHLLSRFNKNLGKYKEDSLFPYFSFAGGTLDASLAGCGLRLTGAGPLIGVNVDTGAVYGKALSCLRLDAESFFEKGEMTLTQVRQDRSYRLLENYSHCFISIRESVAES